MWQNLHGPSTGSGEARPDPPYDIEIFEPIKPPCPDVSRWIPADNVQTGFEWFNSNAKSA